MSVPQAQQRRLLALLQEAQQVFLLVAGFVRNRLNEALGEIELPARRAMHEIALGVGANLEAAADQLAGRTARSAPALPELVAAAEASLAIDAGASTDPPGAAQALAVLRSPLELYRSLAPMLERLAQHAREVRDGTLTA